MGDPTNAYDALKADVLVNWAAALTAVGRDKKALEKCEKTLINELEEVKMTQTKNTFDETDSVFSENRKLQNNLGTSLVMPLALGILTRFWMALRIYGQLLGIALRIHL